MIKRSCKCFVRQNEMISFLCFFHSYAGARSHKRDTQAAGCRSLIYSFKITRALLLKHLNLSPLSRRYSVILNGEEPNFPEPYYYIIPFFVVVCIIVVILVVALIVKVCRESFHSRRARLSKRHLKKLPTKKFVKSELAADVLKNGGYSLCW